MGQGRSARISGYLVLGVALASVAVGVGRFAWHTSAFAIPFAQTGSWPESRETLSEWWGGRFFPFRDGGDYLAVLADHDHWRSPNYVIGAVLEEQGQTAADQALVVPEDLGLMRQSTRVSNYQNADGSVRSVESVVFEYERIRSTTTIPLESRPYDPALDDQTWLALTSMAEGPFPYDTYYVSPPAGASGVFVLHTDAAREALLILPIELSPVGPR